MGRSRLPQRVRRAGFQCSSASRKFLNPTPQPPAARCTSVSVLFSEPKIPQSSISHTARVARVGFSALQRAENSSITSDAAVPRAAPRFQCSSASRKFLNKPRACAARGRQAVSVLFSEPKIPQSYTVSFNPDDFVSFSALQRAENSSIDAARAHPG